MPIINIQTVQTGLVGVLPSLAYIETSDPLATVLTAGYLNQAVQAGETFSIPCMAFVSTKETPTSAARVGTFAISHSGANWSIVSASSPAAGVVTLPTILNHIAIYSDTSGTLAEDAATAINGGNLQAGLSGTAGYLASFPATAARGSLRLVAANNAGNTVTQITNASFGQASVLTIPDPGAATANFLLDTGAANIIAMQQFAGINNVLTFGTGTWTTTRIAQGNYVSRHTAGDETSIIALDITPIIRTAAAKGWRLDTFEYMYSITTLAMDAHTITLDRIAYANNVAVSVTSIPITGSLATATQANPYMSTLTVTTPAFDVTANSKYIIEITANNAATTEYDFYGVMLKFSQTVA